MTKNLETADRIVKLVLAVSTIVLFTAGIISGPFALTLVVLSSFVIVLFAARFFFKRID